MQEQDNKGKNKIVRTAVSTAILMAMLTLLSKFLGFGREMIMAGFFGAGEVVDAFVMAQSIPNFLITGFTTAMSVAFLPLMAEKTEKEGKKAGDLFANDALNILLKVSLVVAIIGIIFASPLVDLFARGFSEEAASLTSAFLRITFIYLIFNAANNMMTSYLQYYNIFLKPVVFSYSLNFFAILFIVIAAYFGNIYMAIGWIFGHATVNLLLKNEMKKNGFFRKFSLKNTNATAKEVLHLAFPTFIGSYVNVLNRAVDKFLAAGLVTGTVAALGYASRITELVTGMTASLLGVIIFPKLNRDRVNNDMKHYNEVLQAGINVAAIIALPFALGGMAFSDEVIQAVYERGAFDPTATAMTGIAFFYYAPDILFISMNTLIIQAYHSHKDMKTPMYIGFVAVFVNVGLNIWLSSFMGIAGIALSTSIANFVALSLRMIFLKKKHPQIKAVESYKKLVKIGVVSAISVGSAWIFKYGWSILFGCLG